MSEAEIQDKYGNSYLSPTNAAVTAANNSVENNVVRKHNTRNQLLDT